MMVERKNIHIVYRLHFRGRNFNGNQSTVGVAFNVAVCSLRQTNSTIYIDAFILVTLMSNGVKLFNERGFCVNLKNVHRYMTFFIRNNFIRNSKLYVRNIIRNTSIVTLYIIPTLFLQETLPETY